MDTLRVDIAYRPLRIGWAIRADDIEAVRRAVRLSHTLWGGRFNPILIVDRAQEARRLAELFRVDMIHPIGTSPELREFSKSFPHLITPIFNGALYSEGWNRQQISQVLDVDNTLDYLHDSVKLKAILEKGVRLYSWNLEDPLADVFLVQFGAYPDAADIGIDYLARFKSVLQPSEQLIDHETPIPAECLDFLGISFLSRYGLLPHYSISHRRDTPGFYVGSSSDCDDLVCHWNLRALDIPIWFVDPAHLPRYSGIVPAWERAMRNSVAHRHEWDRQLGVWYRGDLVEDVREVFGELELIRCPVSDVTWNGLNVRAPMMALGDASVLGVVGTENGKPKVSFAFSEKPFSADPWFNQQKLVASLSFLGGLFGDEHHTLRPPYVPELNEFCSRSMYFQYDKLRIEPDRVGLVIGVAEHDALLLGLPVADAIERCFDLAGFSTRLSPGGLILRQLVSRLNGLQGGRVFKIPGVRRLLKTFGPNDSFTKKTAIELIASNNEADPRARFGGHENLYIERRSPGTKLTPPDCFAHMVERGLFRIGVELHCPSCRMKSWTPLDTLRTRAVCELCGHAHDASRQLVGSEWTYRRSGLLGAERNIQGAIPVALVLQQLDANLLGGSAEGMYSVSLDLSAKGAAEQWDGEIDFIWLVHRPYPEKPAVILGECKDQGFIAIEEFCRDLENMRRVADALPQDRFDAFILFAKLSPFTPSEIAQAKTLNGQYLQRVILLTNAELEPYELELRAENIPEVARRGNTPENLAIATAALYFN